MTERPWAHNVGRRDALKLGFVAGATALFADCAGALESQSGLIRRKIPSSGEEIPIIGLGSAGTFNLTRSSPGYADAREVLRLFRELGGTVIDTAPTYQRSEIFLGEVLGDLGITKDVFISTKVNVGGAGKLAARSQMEGSSSAYGRQTLDLMQVWNLGDSIRSLTDEYLATHMEAVTEWKAQKRARYIGITTARDPQYADFEAAMNKYKIDFVQLDYSIAQEDRIPEQRLLPLAKEKGIAVLVNRPFGAGQFFRRVAGKKLPPWAAEIDCTSWAQFVLKFIISHPAVTATVPATGDPAHLRDNMGAGVGRLPDAAMRAKMIAHFESL
jgi:aryl-alcohol dehydrogenase-like predicted oxidoreductase